MTRSTKTKRCLQLTLVALLAGCAAPPMQRAGLERIEHIVVIYAENRSFDNLYGLFPGANGVANATAAQYTQVDRDGKPLSTLPPVWNRHADRPSDRACPEQCAGHTPRTRGRRRALCL